MLKSIESLEKLFSKRTVLDKKIEDREKKLLVEVQKESKHSPVKSTKPKKVAKPKNAAGKVNL